MNRAQLAFCKLLEMAVKHKIQVRLEAGWMVVDVVLETHPHKNFEGCYFIKHGGKAQGTFHRTLIRSVHLECGTDGNPLMRVSVDARPVNGVAPDHRRDEGVQATQEEVDQLYFPEPPKTKVENTSVFLPN